MKRIVLLVAMVCVLQSTFGQASYEKSIDLQGGPALDSHTKYSVGASTTHGARIENFFIGAGTGFRYTNALYYSSYESYYQFGTLQSKSHKSYDVKYLVPSYVRASYRFGSSSVRPMISFDLGTTIDVGQNQEHKNAEGLFYEPAVGSNISIDETTTMFISVGLNCQNTHHTFYSLSYYDVATTDEINGMASTLNFKLGLTF